MDLPHTINVAIHVLCATVALLVGCVQLFAPKADAGHRRRGRLFLRCLWIVLATKTAGLVLFQFRAFLAVITLLVAYWAYSGVRAPRIRETGPSLQDACASAIALGAAALLLVFIHSVRFPWAPAVIYSTLASLVGVASYDLVRFAFPKRWYTGLWLYEHLVKMTGAFNALVAAFAGTVLSAWQPYSQLVPSIAGTTVMIAMVVRYRR